mmetsp:Transcript_44173/g.102011  ORF Transcript_44173/g.102011 Transcript_44173/m.102011 type:complete len:177 (+) Transcript_44173:450-980(+)
MSGAKVLEFEEKCLAGRADPGTESLRGEAGEPSPTLSAACWSGERHSIESLTDVRPTAPLWRFARTTSKSSSMRSHILFWQLSTETIFSHRGVWGSLSPDIVSRLSCDITGRIVFPTLGTNGCSESCGVTCRLRLEWIGAVANASWFRLGLRAMEGHWSLYGHFLCAMLLIQPGTA